MTVKINLDDLAKERILTKMNPDKTQWVLSIDLNLKVGKYTKQEGIRPSEAWNAVKQRAYELVTEAFAEKEVITHGDT